MSSENCISSQSVNRSTSEENTFCIYFICSVKKKVLERDGSWGGGDEFAKGLGIPRYSPAFHCCSPGIRTQFAI